jgi:hypothetical protein
MFKKTIFIILAFISIVGKAYAQPMKGGNVLGAFERDLKYVAL